MADSRDFVASVYDKLAGIINAEGTSESLVMQMAWPGYSLTPADFKPPGAANGPYDVDIAREAFSQLANLAPTLNKTYFENSGFDVDDLYEIVISSAMPVTPTGADPTANPLHRLFSDAQFELAQNRRGFKNDPNRFYLPCTPTPANWYDEAAAQTWPLVEIKASEVKPPQPTSPFVKIGGLKLLESGIVKMRPDAADEQAVKAAVAQAIDRRNVVLKQKFPAAASAPMLRAPAAATRPGAAGARALPSHAMPNALAREVVAQPHAAPALQTKPAPVNVFLRADLKSAVQSVRVNPQTFTAEPAARVPLNRSFVIKDLFNQRLVVKPVSPATNGFSISFRFCRVNIDRPWLKLALLSSPGWTMSHTNTGAYSTGTLDDNAGMFPLLPLAFIAIRDLRITANWSPEDRANLDKGVSFGFFDIRNGGFSQNTYEVKGLQIIAWLSRLMPPLPPMQAS
jgi:hypothetical protein